MRVMESQTDTTPHAREDAPTFCPDCGGSLVGVDAAAAARVHLRHGRGWQEIRSNLHPDQWSNDG